MRQLSMSVVGVVIVTVIEQVFFMAVGQLGHKAKLLDNEM